MDSVGVFSLWSMGFPFGYISKTHVRVGMFLEEIAGCMACWFADILPYAVDIVYSFGFWYASMILTSMHMIYTCIRMYTYNIHYNKCIYIYRERNIAINHVLIITEITSLYKNSEHLSTKIPPSGGRLLAPLRRVVGIPRWKESRRILPRPIFCPGYVSWFFCRYVLFRGISAVYIYI